MKKLIGIIAIIAAALLTLTVGVSAERYLDEDFSANSTAVFSSVGDPPDTSGWSRTVSGGAFHFVNNTQNTMSQVLMCDETRLGEGAILQFDLKIDDATADGYIMFNLYRGGDGANGGRMSVTFRKDGVRAVPFGESGNVTFANSAPTLGVWYTYYFKTFSSDGNSKGDVYRKITGSADLPVFIGTVNIDKAHVLNAQLQPYGAKGMDAWIDNIKIYNDTFVESTALEMNGAPVTALGDIASGTLTVTLNMVNSEIVTETVGGVTKEKFSDAIPVMVAYNKYRRMVFSRVFNDAGIHMGENALELTIDTSSFADKLNGGYIGFYFWDGIDCPQPIMDAVELQ